MEFGTEISYMKRVQGMLRENFQPNNYYFLENSEPYQLPYLIPAHVYTFEYLDNVDQHAITTIDDYLISNNIDQPGGIDRATRKELTTEIDSKGYQISRPYYDTRPIGLSLGGFNDPGSEYILNIKCSPLAERNRILEILFRGIVPNMLRNGINESNEPLPFMKRINNQGYTQPFVSFQMKNLTDYLGSGIYFWVNKYNKERMRNVRLIDFDQLPKLGFLEYSSDPYLRFNGTSLKEVQSLYLTKVKNR